MSSTHSVQSDHETDREVDDTTRSSSVPAPGRPGGRQETPAIRESTSTRSQNDAAMDGPAPLPQGPQEDEVSLLLDGWSDPLL